jgi:hypothetical protein
MAILHRQENPGKAEKKIGGIIVKSNFLDHHPRGLTPPALINRIPESRIMLRLVEVATVASPSMARPDPSFENERDPMADDSPLKPSLLRLRDPRWDRRRVSSRGDPRPQAAARCCRGRRGRPGTAAPGSWGWACCGSTAPGRTKRTSGARSLAPPRCTPGRSGVWRTGR